MRVRAKICNAGTISTWLIRRFALATSDAKREQFLPALTGFQQKDPQQ
jgi:hypothetical protein